MMNGFFFWAGAQGVGDKKRKSGLIKGEGGSAWFWVVG